ncbi:hypothetical protein TeGR_g7726 [Tetraparma gracilis]|uniref:Uncharacterized protein n=1 Tax=Tetraparma gracilis TaxID=2962635 RepID=A0ABQ6N6L8_9STRA|nr:hypothetical protein TeGR_g7726 [Tetraparma gracilis]
MVEVSELTASDHAAIASSPSIQAALSSSSASPALVTPPPSSLFYTPSMMMSTMNASLSATGGSCVLNRKLDDGSLVPASQGEKDAADAAAKMRQSAEQIANLTQEEKGMWAEDRRGHGNDHYREGEFQKAMDVYMTCLVGMAPADSPPAELRASDEKIALPALLNMAACAFQLGNYSKTVQICDQATSLASGVGRESGKVAARRGRARMKRGEHDLAAKDLRKALELFGEGGEGSAEVMRDLRRVKELKGKARENREKMEKAMKDTMEKGREKGEESFYGSRKGEREREAEKMKKKKAVSSFSSDAGAAEKKGGGAKEEGKKGFEFTFMHALAAAAAVLVAYYSVFPPA